MKSKPAKPARQILPRETKRRTARVQVNFFPEEKDLIERAADRLNQAYSRFIAEAALEKAAQILG